MSEFTNIQNICDYSTNQIGKHEYYFFDAHVWVFFLFHQDSDEVRLVKDHEPQYIKFFDTLVRIHVQKLRTKYRPKIIMTSVLFTEVMHAYFVHRVMTNHIEDEWADNRDYWMGVYSSNKEPDDMGVDKLNKYYFINWFKTARSKQTNLLKFGFPYYRTTPHFKIHYKRVSDRFKQLSAYIEVGNHIKFDYKTMEGIIDKWGQEPSVYCDFNDYYYYYFCQQDNLKVPLVTHDSGFRFKSAHIITGQIFLLNLNNSNQN